MKGLIYPRLVTEESNKTKVLFNTYPILRKD